MARIYEVEGTFYVRSGTLEQWSDESTPGRGALRILGRGEIGWVVGTSNFKIGDGFSMWKDLNYIVPGGSGSDGVYALRLGTQEKFYTYDDVTNILSKLDVVGETVVNVPNEVTSLKTKVSNIDSDLQSSKVIHYSSFSDFPSIGKEGPIYIDDAEGQAYFFNISTYKGEGVGWKKLTGFDILQCKL